MSAQQIIIQLVNQHKVSFIIPQIPFLTNSQWKKYCTLIWSGTDGRTDGQLNEWTDAQTRKRNAHKWVIKHNASYWGIKMHLINSLHQYSILLYTKRSLTCKIKLFTKYFPDYIINSCVSCVSSSLDIAGDLLQYQFKYQLKLILNLPQKVPSWYFLSWKGIFLYTISRSWLIN